jgi:hypothetical protein
MNLTDKCCCRHVYGDHLHKKPHACNEPRCACPGFRRPLTKRDLPDFWIDAARMLDHTGERAVQAESAASDRVFHSLLVGVGAFDDVDVDLL